MKTTKRNITNAILFLAVLLATQTATAFYCPSTGRWLSRDPIGEPGFEVLRTANARPQVGSSMSSPSRWISRDPVVAQGGANRYLFVRNDSCSKVDLYGLACGSFVVSSKKVPIYGLQADLRNLSSGTLVDGFSVRFKPDRNCCCAKNDIRIVQLISHKFNYIPGWTTPAWDGGNNPVGTPPTYGGQGNGNLEIYDAPWSQWLFGTQFKIEDCALCGGKNLGCVSFKWAYDSSNSNPTLDPSGTSYAKNPDSSWNNALGQSH